MGPVVEVVHVLALHGFLGQGQDWQLVQNTINIAQAQSPHAASFKVQWLTPSLFSNQSAKAQNTLNSQDISDTSDTTLWDLSSFESVTQQILQSVSQIPGKKIFVGYSLGGRIGLHLMEKAPQEFEHFIFLSTHSGLLSAIEKQARLQQDESWTQTIQNNSWEDFLQKWNQQSVFDNKQNPIRLASDFSKTALAESMLNLSLAKQKNFNQDIQSFRHKITWAVGQKDSKFVHFANELIENKILNEKKELDAGHRVLLDSPSQVADLILKAILTII